MAVALSLAGYFPYAYMPTAPPGKGTWSYLASKAAAAHLTRMMAGSLMKRHVTVNAIAPGFFPSSKQHFRELMSM